jgi:putative transposase
LGIFTPAYTQNARRLFRNPPTGRLGIFHASLQAKTRVVSPAIPQPAGWGSFTPAYKQKRASSLPQFPNRQVGDLSRQPISKENQRLQNIFCIKYLFFVLTPPITQIKWAYQLHFYICFRTRWRRAAFGDAEREASLSRLLAEICTNHDYHLLQSKVYQDHLRCLLSLKPNQSISKVVNMLKSNMSREFCLSFGLRAPLWAAGYLARSVGRIRIQAVKEYLANQAEHHGYSKRVNPPVFRYRCNQPVSLRAAHAVFDLRYHLVFATRYRRGVFSSTLGSELLDYWLKIADKRGFALDDASVLPEHVHLLVRLAPKMSIEECALSLMNNSQYWMLKHHKGALVRAGIDTVWQPSAYAGSCGKVTTAMVKSFLSRK